MYETALTIASICQLTMQQAILQHFPKINVTYRFTNRAQEMLFSRECFELAKQSISRKFPSCGGVSITNCIIEHRPIRAAAYIERG
jgi:uncharacterized protein YbbK (DUF523 family)